MIFLKKVYGVLYYLITVKFVELLTKMFIEPYLKKKGVSEKHRECLILLGEVLEIVALIIILKGTRAIYNK